MNVDIQSGQSILQYMIDKIEEHKLAENIEESKAKASETFFQYHKAAARMHLHKREVYEEILNKLGVKDE